MGRELSSSQLPSICSICEWGAGQTDVTTDLTRRQSRVAKLTRSVWHCQRRLSPMGGSVLRWEAPAPMCKAPSNTGAANAWEDAGRNQPLTCRSCSLRVNACVDAATPASWAFMGIRHCAAPQGPARPSAPDANCWASGPRSYRVLRFSSMQSAIFRFPVPCSQATSRITLPPLPPPHCSVPLGFPAKHSRDTAFFLKSGTVPKTQGYKSRERIRHFFWNFPRVRNTLCSRD